MRIAFVGKGGSGKTTITALMGRFLAAKGLPALAIDADINQQLAASVGYMHPLPALGLHMPFIKDYLCGSNNRIKKPELMIKTTPPGKGSRLMTLQKSNELFDFFIRKQEGLKLIAVGAFNEEDLGIKCYHSKTGIVELILNHLIDKPKEYILIDMTAGSDAFASGLFTRFDITLLIVEPTLKSIGVYKQYKDYAMDFGVVIKVIGNKIESEGDLDFIKKHTGNDLIAHFSRSKFVKSTEKGDVRNFDFLEKENVEALQKMIYTIDIQKKDWRKYYEQAIYFHRKNADNWANAQSGTDLKVQIDPDFAYPVS